MNSESYIWHPFTQMKLADKPIHIIKGDGAWLIADNGTKYLDAISSWWTNLHGHAHPYIAKKIAEQAGLLEHVIFAGFTHTPAEKIAKRLIENYLPASMQKIFFSDNGSTSVEVAIKMALQYWANISTPKKRIIAFENGYHGDTFGSMSVSDRGIFTKPFHSFLFDVTFITPPLPGREAESLRQLEFALKDNDVAAFIYEPLIMGAGGMLMYSSDALEPLLKSAKEHAVICIADEVMTGFYRTGKMFASAYQKTDPDIMCLSKGLTGGTMALGITACSQFIYDAFYSDDKMKTFYHGHSYTANPLACAVANASLDLIEQPDFSASIENIINKNQSFSKRLHNINGAENIRQTGTILAWDIASASETGYFNTIRERLYTYFIEKGILLRPLGNTLYIMPPYCITASELESVYNAVEEFLSVM